MAVRVHELAKEFGVPSKVILSTLSDMGEYVKSASSTVEAPVIRRLKEEHGDALTKLGAKSAPAKKAPAKKPARSRQPRSRPPRHLLPKRLSPEASRRKSRSSSSRPRPSKRRRHLTHRLHRAPRAPSLDDWAGRAHGPAGARPGNNPFSSRQGMQQDRAPRPPADHDGAAGTALAAARASPAPTRR